MEAPTDMSASKDHGVGVPSQAVVGARRTEFRRVRHEGHGVYLRQLPIGGPTHLRGRVRRFDSDACRQSLRLSCGSQSRLADTL